MTMDDPSDATPTPRVRPITHALELLDAALASATAARAQLAKLDARVYRLESDAPATPGPVPIANPDV